MALWEPEKVVNNLSVEGLAVRYENATHFGTKVTFQPECTLDQATIVAFLELHYDNQCLPYFKFILSCPGLAVALVDKQTEQHLLGFVYILVWPMQGLGVPEIIFSTLLCVVPFLRHTGLMVKFVAASRWAAAQKYNIPVGIFTTPKLLNMPPLAQIYRYIYNNGSCPVPLHWTVQANLELAQEWIGRWTVTVPGIAWAARPFKTTQVNIFGYVFTDAEEPLGAVVVVQMTTSSFQILGFGLRDSGMVGTVLAVLQNYLKVFCADPMVIIDANVFPLASQDVFLRPGIRTPFYYVYMHNKDHKFLGAQCAIPLL